MENKKASENTLRQRPPGRKRGSPQLNFLKSEVKYKMGKPKKPTVRSPSLSSELTVSSKEIPSGKQKHMRSIKERLNTALAANNVQADQIKVMTMEIESLKRFVNTNLNTQVNTEIINMDPDDDEDISLNVLHNNLERNKNDTDIPYMPTQAMSNNSVQQIQGNFDNIEQYIQGAQPTEIRVSTLHTIPPLSISSYNPFNSATHNKFTTTADVHQSSSTQVTISTDMPVSAGKKRKLFDSQPCSSSSAPLDQPYAEKQPAVYKLKKIPADSPLNTIPTSSARTTQSQLPNCIRPANQQTAKKQSQSSSNITQPIKEIPPPPIKVSELNVKATTELLEQLLGHKNFSFHRASPTDTFIRTSCKADHKAILEVLRNSDISGHSFTPKDEKKTSILLRNVCSSYNTEDILNGIADYGIDVKVSSIDPFVTERSNRSNRTLNIWRITLEPGSDVNALLSQKFINQLSGIHYERMRSNGLTQCYNCQDFGHVASNCFRDFRCVKCHLTHVQGKCPTDNRTDDSAPRPSPACVNCGKTGHPANYRGCEVHQELLKRLNAKKTIQREAQVARQAYYNNFRQSNKSYAEAMAPRPTSSNMHKRTSHSISPNNNHSLGFDIQAECHAQFGMDFRNIRQRLSEFAPYYRTAEDKGIALIQFIASIHPDYQNDHTTSANY